MPTLTVTKQYSDETILTEAQVDALIDSIEEFVNVTKLDSDNLQNQAVTEAKLANNSVTTAALADAAVTGAKISDGSITRAKLEPLGEQTTSEVNATLTNSMADLAGLSCTITTSGRPVLLALVAGGSVANSFWTVTGSGSAYIQIIRDGVTIVTKTTAAATAIYPLSAIALDSPTAGTYTYKVQGQKDAGATSSINQMKLIAVET